MGIPLSNSQHYFHVAYRTGANGYAEIELIKTDALHENPCYQTEIDLGHVPISVTPVAIFTNNLTPVKNTFALDQDVNPYNLTPSCEDETICDCDHLATDVAAGYTYTNTGLSVNFTPVALSPNCDSVEWNFGDNSAIVNSQGNQTVTHTYVWPEMFDVCMKVTRYMNDGTTCTDSICERIDLTTVGVDNFEDVSIHIWPNPVNDELYISSVGEQQQVNYIVVNALGETVRSGKLNGNVSTVIQTGELAKGLYIIQIRYAEGVSSRKFLKQ